MNTDTVTRNLYISAIVGLALVILGILAHDYSVSMERDRIYETYKRAEFGRREALNDGVRLTLELQEIEAELHRVASHH